MKPNQNVILWCLIGSLGGNLLLRVSWIFLFSDGNPLAYYRLAGPGIFLIDLLNLLMCAGGLALLLVYRGKGKRALLLAAAVLFILTPGMNYAWPHFAFALYLFWQAGQESLEAQEGLETTALRLLQALVILELLWDAWFLSPGGQPWTGWILYGLLALSLALTLVSVLRFRIQWLRIALLCYLAANLAAFFISKSVVSILAPQAFLAAYMMFLWGRACLAAKTGCDKAPEGIE